MILQGFSTWWVSLSRGNVGRFLHGFCWWISHAVGAGSGSDAAGSCEIGIGLWVAGDLEQRELGGRAVGGREAARGEFGVIVNVIFSSRRPATRWSSAGPEMELDGNPSGQ